MRLRIKHTHTRTYTNPIVQGVSTWLQQTFPTLTPWQNAVATIVVLTIAGFALATLLLPIFYIIAFSVLYIVWPLLILAAIGYGAWYWYKSQPR